MLVIFTDLDGSLLNHDDYSYSDATESLEKIKKLKIPLIFTTSKTRIEVELLQQEIGIKEPFIVENGAAIFFPLGYRNFRIDAPVKDNYQVIVLGETYQKIREFFNRVKGEFGLKGFGDMSVEEVAALTGLSVEKAKLAKQREFTEPFITEKPELLSELEKLAEKNGLKITKGGRFYHLIGKNQDKGKAVKITSDIFKKNIGDIITIGIGDSKNDIPMLENVDIPILIPKINNKYEEVNIKNLIKAPYPGSKGWNAVVRRLINEFTPDGS
ncbi:HAD-IIB family hydrolase [Persephonella sp. IF05-L8]|uniref:HAD-IIB family hydrolase n=1 Tax=Persephonella sp. IF05-L8 TaxID=1158338 RepID=UPI0004982C09